MDSSDYIGIASGLRAFRDCVNQHGKDAKAVAKCIEDRVAQRKKPADPSSAGNKDFYNFAFLNFKFRQCIKNAGSNHDKAQKCHEDYENEVHKLKQARSQNH